MNTVRLFKKINFYLILAIVLIFPLGQLTRIVLPWPEVRLYWHDLLVFLLVMLFFGQFCRFLITKLKKTGLKSTLQLIKVSPIFKLFLLKPILLFFLAALLSLLVNLDRFSLTEIFLASLYLIRWGFYISIYIAVSGFNPSQKAKLTEYLILSGIIFVIFGLIQFRFFPDAWPLISDQWDPHMARVISTFLDPGFTGLIYVLLMVLLTLFGWKKIHQTKINFYHFGLLITFLIMLLTYSRSAYLSFVVALASVSWLKKAPGFFATILTIFIISLFLLPRPHGEGTKLERISTIESRIKSWRQAASIALKNPVFGVGFNTYRYEQKNLGLLKAKWQLSHSGAGVDNSLLFIWVTTGIIGLSAYGWFYQSIIKFCWQRKELIFRQVLFASALVILTHSIFNNSLFYAWNMLWLWFLAGLGSKGH